MTPQIMGGLIRARRMVLEIDAQDELTNLKLQNIAAAIEHAIIAESEVREERVLHILSEQGLDDFDKADLICK